MVESLSIPAFNNSYAAEFLQKCDGSLSVDVLMVYSNMSPGLETFLGRVESVNELILRKESLVMDFLPLKTLHTINYLRVGGKPARLPRFKPY